jgi:cyclopropane fatty-acyl-phospholipid synthase-like methyltransferase
MKFKINKNKGWIVKNQRPEEFLLSPKFYYTDDEVEKYCKSNAMRKAQEKIAHRIVELLDLPKKSKILDLGSGPGITAEVYRAEGFKVTCLDIIPKMLEKARENGFECVLGNMTNLLNLFPKRKFDAIVSVSAIQWLKNKEDLENLAEGIYFLLKKNSPCIIQFYPKSEQELKETIRTFKQNSFSCDSVIDNPQNPRKRTIFLIIKKIG